MPRSAQPCLVEGPPHSDMSGMPLDDPMESSYCTCMSVMTWASEAIDHGRGRLPSDPINHLNVQLLLVFLILLLVWLLLLLFLLLMMRLMGLCCWPREGMDHWWIWRRLSWP